MNVVQSLLKLIPVADPPGSTSFNNLRTQLHVCSLNEKQLKNLSSYLSLEDIKLSLQSFPRETKNLLDFIASPKEFDTFTDEFSLEKRINSASNEILKHIDLTFLQSSEEIIPFKNMSAWYALAPDEMLLKRPVSDIKQLFFNPHIIAARLNDIAMNQPHLMKQFENREADMRIGSLRFLSAEEINSLAPSLPIGASALLTEEQMLFIDRSNFPDNALEPMIGGDASRKSVGQRVFILSPEERIKFINCGSGYLSNLLPTSFFQTLELSKVNKRSIKALFLSNPSGSFYSIQQVPPEEIAKSFHRLPKELIKYLSNEQLRMLNYKEMDFRQIYLLFGPRYHSNIEKIRLIPANMVDAILEIDCSLVTFFSSDQLKALDTNLLSNQTISALFPGFTTATLYPGYKLTVCGREHIFTSQQASKVTTIKHSKASLNYILNQNLRKCEEMVRNFSEKQREALYPRVHPECQRLIKKE